MLPDFCCSARAFRASVVGIALLLGGGTSELQAQVATAPQPTPAIQSVPTREEAELSAALSRLSREPRNVEALILAGNAASKLGDFEAAVGFFKRGEALAPGNPSLLAGMAGAMVRQGDAAGAIPMFAQAQAAGASAQAIASDRGLAYDLIGDPQSAQRYYAQALRPGVNDDELTLRLAISQAISGNAAAMEKTLLPLLKKQDKAAWRTRAFGLAIVGQTKEAGRIVKTLLPGRLAEGITPYLDYMPRLTRAQQAAAANLGIFPRASEIGRDERLAALSPPVAGRDTGKALVPSGMPLGSAVAGSSGGAKPSSRDARRQEQEAQALARREAKAAREAAAENAKREARLARVTANQQRVAPPEVRPAREDAPSGETGFAMAGEPAVPKLAEIMAGRQAVQAPPVGAAPASSAVSAPAPSSTPAAQIAMASSTPQQPQPAAIATPSPRPSVSLQGFDLGRMPATGAAADAPAPAQADPPSPASAIQAAPAPSFGALFADLGKPTADPSPAAGAVDIRKIVPARPKPKPKPEPEPKKPVITHPSRIWVQLGIGQKLPALAQEWKRKEKVAPALFKGRKPYTARLNQTNRLLAGPFASQKEAQKFIEALAKAGLSGPYIWTSPTGEVVDDLAR